MLKLRWCLSCGLSCCLLLGGGSVVVNSLFIVALIVLGFLCLVCFVVQ